MEGVAQLDRQRTVSVQEEFKTVDLVLSSGAKTCGVDAFALSLIKLEKQARRLLTYLVYQHAWCGPKTVQDLKDTLEQSGGVYFDGLVAGWNALYPRTVEELVGSDYKRLRARIDEATGYRNKIFHGQLTGKGLGTAALTGLVRDLRSWCDALGGGAQAEVGYDGCDRNSFHKVADPGRLVAKYKVRLADIAAYRKFIQDHMERKRPNKRLHPTAAR